MELEWLSILNKSAAAREGGPLLMTLATIDDERGVDARTVVCRDVGPDGAIWFTSDSRSNKNAQLAVNANAAGVIWLPLCRRQFRFRGSVETVASSDQRSRIWSPLTDATKASFFWPTPGAERTSGQFDGAGDLTSPPDAFSVLKLSPIEVELLELESTPHRRRRWQSSHAWQTEELNP